MLLKKILLSTLCIILFLSLINSSIASPCEVEDIRDTLRKALYLFFTDPSASTLNLEEVKDLLVFYLSITDAQATTECSEIGTRTNKSISEILENGRDAPDRIPSCFGGTKYGQCSKIKPKYCYRGKLFNRCTQCGCPDGAVCDGTSCVGSIKNPECIMNNDCGSSKQAPKYYCDGQTIIERIHNLTCNDPGTTKARCDDQYHTRNIKDCKSESNKFCIEGKPTCQDEPKNNSTGDKVTLDRIYISDSKVDVIYSKNFATCLHLIDETDKIVHSHNYFCRQGDNKMGTGDKANFHVSENKRYKVCHGNNRKVCSNYKLPSRVYSEESSNVLAELINQSQSANKYIIRFSSRGGFKWIESRRSNGDYKTGGEPNCALKTNSEITSLYEYDFPLVTFYSDCKYPGRTFRVETLNWKSGGNFTNYSGPNNQTIQTCSPTKLVRSNITTGTINPNLPRNIFIKAYAGSSNPSDIYGQLDYRGWSEINPIKNTGAVVILVRHERSSFGSRSPIQFRGGSFNLQIDSKDFIVTLPESTVCWSCNLWYILHEDGKIEQWKDGFLTLEQWINNKIESCDRENSISKIKLDRLFADQFNNTKYVINVSDGDGIKFFDIRKRDGSYIYGGIPNCVDKVRSGPVTIDLSDFPLTAQLRDCKIPYNYTMYIDYPPLPLNNTSSLPCTDSDGGKNYLVKGTSTGIYYGSTGPVKYGVFPNPGIAKISSDQFSTVYDYCEESNNELLEGFCDGNDLHIISHKCPHGCSNGKCKPIGGVDCPHCLPKELVLYLTFNESVGNKVYDSSRYQNNGTIVGATWAPGRIGTGIYFDGNDYVVIPDSQSLDVRNKITVTAWIKLDPGSASGKIIQKGWTKSAYQLGAWFGNPNGYAFEIYDDQGRQNLVDSGSNPIREKWQHIATTYDGNVMKMYIDGVQKGREIPYSGKISISSNDLYIGMQPNKLMGLKGMIDELHIYNESKSPDIICLHANKQWLNGECVTKNMINSSNCDVKINGVVVKSIYATDRQDCYSSTSFGSNNCKTYTPYFKDGTHFLEQFYDKNDRVNNEYCACNDGVCIQGKDACIDHDNGENLLNASYASKGSQSQYDKCSINQNNEIIEGVCINGQLLGVPRTCPTGTFCKEVTYIPSLGVNASACII